MKEIYQLAASEALEVLGTDLETGLTQSEAAKRLSETGPNELQERGIKSPWRILWEQVTSIMVVILILAAIISALLGDTTDSIAILAIIVLNSLIGFQQEYKAEQALSALKKMAVPHVRVKRDGHVREIPARELVPGDIVLLEAGNLVPADCRLIENFNLQIDESALTGESLPIEKDSQFVAATDMPLGDRVNMVYMGTIATYGRGVGLVVKTGMDTELGQIAAMLQTTGQEKTPLQRRLDQLSKGLALAALGLVFLVFILGVIRREELELMLLTAISMAVAAVPEGLPAVVTIALALGAQRMLKRRALIRKLPAVEGLGSVTVICSDKTGTLTENRMTVRVLDVAGHRIDLVEEERVRGERGHFEVQIPGGGQEASLVRENPALSLLLLGGALANDAILEQSDNSLDYVGDPTEGALLIAAAKAGMLKPELEKIFPRVSEVPFDSDRKRMTTVHEFPESVVSLPESYRILWDREENREVFPYIVFSKGAVDSLLEVCGRVWVTDHAEPLNESWRLRIITANEEQAKDGMRVLGVAFRSSQVIPENGSVSETEKDLIFIGLVGLMDPARPEVKAAVQTCKTAGIRPIMITGDHPLTARKIAEELGISRNGNILTGRELAKMNIDDFENIVETVNVYARVAPEHKYKIVQALQRRGQIVAMTGDGVNDAPALKQADIGVAMGITGTDVSKEAADIVLLDDNFATIVAAIEEGRRIYDNIRKFFRYTMTSNAGEIWTMLLAPFLGMPFPLLPLQILWINLVTDGLPGLAMSVEPAERDIMRRPPYPPNENVFGRGMARQILWIGMLMGIVSLAAGYWFWSQDHPQWRTIVFTTLTLSQMGNALALRSERDSLFKVGLLSNQAMLGAVLLTLGLQLAVVYIPFLQRVFNTGPLSLVDLVICLGLSSITFLVVEIEKWIIRTRGSARSDS